MTARPRLRSRNSPGRWADKIFDLILASGEFCFLDNFRVVHGRKPFKARHDGTDRWQHLQSIHLQCGRARLIVTTGPTTRESTERHGGGIADIAFVCDDPDAIRRTALAAGAQRP